MKHKNRLILVSLLFSIFLFLAFPQKAEAKYINHTTTPTEFRGTWYIGKNKAVQFYKHSIHIGNIKLTPNKKGINKLYVTIYKYGKGDYTYNFQTKKYSLGGAASLPTYWLTNKKIFNNKVMASYHSMGMYMIYTKNKTKNDYSFVDNVNSMIGNKNNIVKYIGRNKKIFNPK